MQAYLDRLTDAKAISFVNKLGDIFKPLPALPAGFIDFLVKIVPYLALLGGVVSVLGAISTLQFAGTFSSVWLLITLVFTVAQAGLMLIAFNPLKGLEMRGWMLLFWAELLVLLQSVVSLIGITYGSMIITIIVSLIVLYLLFQMKPRYSATPTRID